jgi:hypothetical protein
MSTDNAVVITSSIDHVLFSYGKPVAVITHEGFGHVSDRFYSKTTSKHVNQFFKLFSITKPIVDSEEQLIRLYARDLKLRSLDNFSSAFASKD